MLNKLVTFLNKASIVVVIGMGSELRTDDAVGLHIVRSLRPFINERLNVYEGHMTPEVFIGPACALHPTHVIIVDAAELHQKPGTWSLLALDMIEQGLFTTHSIPAVEVAKEFQRRCGAKVIFLGIQPKSREISLSLSKECQKAAQEIAEIIQRTIS